MGVVAANGITVGTCRGRDVSWHIAGIGADRGWDWPRSGSRRRANTRPTRSRWADGLTAVVAGAIDFQANVR
jgi:hypothetical protein